MREPYDSRERRRLITLVHVGASRLKLDEDTRRAMQLSVTGCATCKDMSTGQLRDMIAALNARGAKLTVWLRSQPSDDRAPLLRKLQALARAGTYPHPAYALGISARMWGAAAPAKVEWHTPKQLRALVAALSYDQRRKKTKLTPAEEPAQ